MDPNNSNKLILKLGTIINEQWKLVDRIGEGTFSQIYSAKSIADGSKVAVKVEQPSGPLRNVLDWESSVLKSMQRFPFVCRYFYHGVHEGCQVLVMELLGENMSRMRQRAAMVGGLPLALCVKVGLQLIDCMKGLHSLGYIHRDIKPSNFVRGLNRNQQDYYIIDFGLVRRYMDQNGKVIPPREKAEFRGTSMYASLNAHHEKELGRRDDMWSLFFVFLDLIRGELPWNREAHRKERDAIAQLKMHYTQTAPHELVDGLPGSKGMLSFMDHLRSLEYEDQPDYELLSKILKDLVDEDNPIPSPTLEDTPKLKNQSVEQHQDWTKEQIALEWSERTLKCLKQGDHLPVLMALLEESQKHETFFLVEFGCFQDFIKVQHTVYLLESKLEDLKSAPPPVIKSFGQKLKHEQKMRGEALRKRRERDEKVRLAIHKVPKTTNNKEDSPEPLEAIPSASLPSASIPSASIPSASIPSSLPSSIPLGVTLGSTTPVVSPKPCISSKTIPPPPPPPPPPKRTESPLSNKDHQHHHSRDRDQSHHHHHHHSRDRDQYHHNHHSRDRDYHQQQHPRDRDHHHHHHSRDHPSRERDHPLRERDHPSRERDPPHYPTDRQDEEEQTGMDEDMDMECSDDPADETMGVPKPPSSYGVPPPLQRMRPAPMMPPGPPLLVYRQGGGGVWPPISSPPFHPGVGGRCPPHFVPMPPPRRELPHPPQPSQLHDPLTQYKLTR